MQTQQLEKMLAHHLAGNLPHHAIKDVYEYAVLPGGKLFRPHLVWSVFSDLNPEAFLASKENLNSNHAKLSSGVEFHHTYTLLHDDLPAMDNDLTRRGKPCTHIAYGEWQALLAGDGLLNISYQLLSKINHPRSQDLFRFFSWALGPKGLIHGQVLDLSHEMTKSFANTLRTHELKTARLIQVAILGSALISLPKKDARKEKALWRYSRLLGVNFQLIDDLSELAESELSQHELDVNPWLRFGEDCLQETSRGLFEFARLSGELKLKNTDKIVADYYAKMLSIIEPNLKTINGHLKGKLDLAPVILMMKTFGNV
nr:polyprenyl synthetase family protein [Bacteriovorax sp. HI3]